MRATSDKGLERGPNANEDVVGFVGLPSICRFNRTRVVPRIGMGVLERMARGQDDPAAHLGASRQAVM